MPNIYKRLAYGQLIGPQMHMTPNRNFWHQKMRLNPFSFRGNYISQKGNSVFNSIYVPIGILPIDGGNWKLTEVAETYLWPNALKAKRGPMKSELFYSEMPSKHDCRAAEHVQPDVTPSAKDFEVRASQIAHAHSSVLKFLSERISALEQDTDIATLRDAMLYFGNELTQFSREARDNRLKNDAKIEAMAGIVEALTARSHAAQTDKQRQDLDLQNRLTQALEQIDAVGQKANTLESIVKKSASRESSVNAQVNALKDSLEQAYASLEAERKLSAILAERMRNIERNIASWNGIEAKIDTMLQRAEDLAKVEDALSRINHEKVLADATLRSVSQELKSTSAATANSNEQYNRIWERLASVEGELASISKRDAAAANYHARLAAAYAAEKATEG